MDFVNFVYPICSVESKTLIIEPLLCLKKLGYTSILGWSDYWVDKLSKTRKLVWKYVNLITRWSYWSLGGLYLRFYCTVGIQLPIVSCVAKSSYSLLVLFPTVYRTLIISKFRNPLLLCFWCVSHSSFLLICDIQNNLC